LLGLLAVTVGVLRPLALTGTKLAALACLTAFTLWSFASIGWSRVEGDAWEGSNKTLLYLFTYALFAVVPWPTRTAMLLVGGYALGVAAIGLLTLADAARASDPGDYFIHGRLSEPIGYQNGACALLIGAFWIALFLATRLDLHAGVRAVGLGAAGILAELSLLTQSRGAIVAVPVCLGLYLLLVSGRLRALVSLALVGTATVLAAPILLDVYPAFRERRAGPAVDESLLAVGVSFVALVLAGCLLALAERRFPLGEARTRAAGRIAAVAAAALACVAIVIVAVSGPVDRVEDAWRDFKGDKQPAAASNFAHGFTTNRYDIWRVALNEFRDSPVVGLGADNFATQYIEARRSNEEVLSPHSLELRTLVQLGLVGGVLLAGFVAFALTAALRGPFESPLARPLAGALVVVFAYWAVHGSIDWFWDVPALTCPALAALAIAAGVGRRERAGGGARLGPAPAVAGVLAVLAAATSLIFPWLAEKEMQQAAGSWRRDPGEAFAQLERASALNPLSERPDLLAGAIASRVDDTKTMRRSFERVLVRNSYNWYAQLELGLLAGSEGRREIALERLAAARKLNPREPAIALATEKVRSGKRIVRAEYDRLFFVRAEAVVD
jgi:hypothetical protein